MTKKELAFDYSAAAYAALTPDEQVAIGKVFDALSGGNLDPEYLENDFDLLRPCDGCVPDAYADENFLENIRKKFSAIYYSAAELADDDLKARGLKWYDEYGFLIVTDPDADSTHVAIVDVDSTKRPFCYLHVSDKPWNFHFATLKEIATAVLEAKQTILKTYSEQMKRRLP